jgi:hypothetical protein
MLYICPPSGPRVREQQQAGRLGAIATPEQGNRHVDGAVWCADNGCGPGAGGGPGKGWPGTEKWWAWLVTRSVHAGTCLFAVAPDVVGDSDATLARSLPWLGPIRELGYPAAFVVQDGAERPGMVPWDLFDVLFIGGSTEWKLGPHARALVAQARARGKRVHMGRVNSERRWRYAEFIGCDTCDGTLITRSAPLYLPKILGWADRSEYLGPGLFGSEDI